VSAVVTRRCIGLDAHREFAQVAIWQDGRVVQAGRVATTPEQLRAFADSLAPTDEVALEATGEQRPDRGAAGQPGGARGGVESGEDPRDRRGEDQD
jgi:hypothetical protein